MKRKFIYIFIALILVLIFLIIYKDYKTNNYNIYQSVVYIESTNGEDIKSGSGFVYKVYKDKTYIITNYHVISDLENIYVYNNDKDSTKAEVFAYDENNDIAIIVIYDSLNLVESLIGNSELLNNEDSIKIIGTPIRLKNINTASLGKIINKDEDIFFDDVEFKSIKIQAKINYGNSGSPVLNKDNEVVAMVFAMDKDSKNVAFAIPINIVIDVVNNLFED